MRGMSGLHDAMSHSSGHLLSNFGTDTVPAIDYLEDYYGANAEAEMIGGSVSATEHSVMCMGGKDDELETFRRLVTEVYPSGIVSIVSDTWDFWHVITETAKTLKPEIMARTPNALGQAKVVFRPDSGDPVKILCGTAIPVKTFSDLCKLVKDDIAVTDDGTYWKIGNHGEYRIDDPTPEMKGAVQCLWEIFGGTTTDKGYKTLDQHVGLIYGDSITIERHYQILKGLMDRGFSAGNVVFGIGSYTYQLISRDTFGSAIKATYGVVNGEARELFKDPATDNGTKKSARGLLRVEKSAGNYFLLDRQTKEEERCGELRPAFCDGHVYNFQYLPEIRARLKAE